MRTIEGDRIYINDFCEDLNHTGVILYIGNIDDKGLLKALERDNVNKLYRLDYALKAEDPAYKDFIYVANCDLQNLDWPLHEYLEEGYHVYILHEDSGKYYVKKHLS